MKPLSLFIISLLIIQNCFTQTVKDKNNQYLESARLVIDILQLFRKKNSSKTTVYQENNKENKTCNFCLLNSDSLQKIRVFLIAKNSLDTLMMVIRSKEKECSLQIKCGIYNCKIEGMDNSIISWGDIYIDENFFELRR